MAVPLQIFKIIIMEYINMDSYYYETGTVKRYTKKIKNKSKNAKEEYRTVETVNIGLSKYSEFKDNEEVAILSLNDYQQLLSTANETETVAVTDVDMTQNSDKLEIIRLHEEINRLQTIINNRNELLISANDNVDKLMDEVLLAVTGECNSLMEDNFRDNKERLKEFIKSIINLYQTIERDNIRIAGELDDQVKEFNQELANTSLWKLWRNKRKLHLPLSTDELKQPVKKLEDLKLLDIDLATERVLKKASFNIAVDKSEIKRNNIDFLELYIKTDPNE